MGAIIGFLKGRLVEPSTYVWLLVAISGAVGYEAKSVAVEQIAGGIAAAVGGAFALIPDTVWAKWLKK